MEQEFLYKIGLSLPMSFIFNLNNKFGLGFSFINEVSTEPVGNITEYNINESTSYSINQLLYIMPECH